MHENSRNRANWGKGEAIRWMHAHFAHEGEDCLIWPFSRDNHGHGLGQANGKRFKAHRLMCEWVDGPRPSPKHQASHSCGNGHLGCVHPKHLSWKTASANQLDRKRHGTAGTNIWGPKGKITIEQAKEIILLKDQPQSVAAEKFQISLPSVRRIQNGRTRTARAALKALETARV